MGKITLILGGARSGKSNFALELARKSRKVAFLATCEGKDAEMKKRIKLHQGSRPENWKTFEEPKDVVSTLNGMGNDFNCIIIDCLTLLVSNLILSGVKSKQILENINLAIESLRKKKVRVIIVSNEVGLGLVPTSKLGRDFRDIAGKVNQAVAAHADEVYFTISGIPMKIKGGR